MRWEPILTINYRRDDFAAAARDFTNGEGVDLILDMVGAEYLERNVSLLKVRGRLVFISTLGGSQAEINIGQLMGKRARLIGFRAAPPRPVVEKAEIIQRFREQFWKQIESGAIKPVIDRVLPVADAHKAHEIMRNYENNRQDRPQSSLSSASSSCTACSIAASPELASVTSRS